MFVRLKKYLFDESGAISVDYTVLSAGAVAMAISATVILTGAIDNITGAVDAELRERQLNDTYIEFKPAHFEPLLETNLVTEDAALELWTSANEKMNQDIINMLEEGIQKIEAGTITEEELGALFAAASVAYQRNVIDDAVLEYYFGFGEGEPMGGQAPNEYCGDPTYC